MLEDPIRDAAERYIDLTLTTPVESDARDRLLQHMSRRRFTPNRTSNSHGKMPSVLSRKP